MYIVSNYTGTQFLSGNKEVSNMWTSNLNEAKRFERETQATEFSNVVTWENSPFQSSHNDNVVIPNM